MGLLNVIVAGLAAFAFGAIWYTLLAKPWMHASGVAIGPDGTPANKSDPLPYIMALISVILVAGMMRHMFVLSGIDTFGKGIVSGLGIGLFIAAPLMMTCYGFAGRARRLFVIDGGYATIGCGVIGGVLTLF